MYLSEVLAQCYCESFVRGSSPPCVVIDQPVKPSYSNHQADLSGTPTITLPVGFSSEGLPLSMQFAGQALSEPTLCRIGHAYEEATGWYKKHPNV